MQLSEGWEFAQADWLREPEFGYTRVPGWLPATVPGYVHLDLMAHGIIRDPHDGLAELGCGWVDESDWSYRCRFRSDDSGATILRFEGLDTVCTIFLNGNEIGRHDNMFVPFEIDVADGLVAGDNELRIDFQSALRVGRGRRAAYFAKHGIPEDVLNFDERAFVRKAQYMFGWDWGPRLVSCGIWKPIHLIPRTSARAPRDPGSSRVTLQREPDSFGESFEFRVDGRPLWARGANWIPVHSFPSETARLRPLLLDAKAMHMNMLRVWGGGLYESDEFYDLCDELDILVWQDFPFACSYYPDDDLFIDQVREEAIHHVERLRHHRCLALWCGNNENLTMWEGKWGGADRQPARFHGERIWNEVLRDVVAEHDPGRAYIPTSPLGGVDGTIGDQHYWDVWHGRGDWIHYQDSTARFSSEFGFPSAGGARAWNPPRSTDPEAPEVRWHDKTGRPYTAWLDLIGRHYPVPKDLEELIYYSQLNQRDAMRCAIEHYRRSELCRGALIWQLNDLWPAQSWSLVDSAGEWKAAAFEVSRLYRDVLVGFECERDRLRLWAVNDSPDSVQHSEIRIQAFDTLDGSLRWEEAVDLDIGPGERRVLFATSLDPFNLTRTLFRETFSMTSLIAVEPKQIQLVAAPIRVGISKRGSLRVAVTSPTIDLWISDGGDGGRGARPTTIPCADSFEIPFQGQPNALRVRSLAGRHRIQSEA